METHGYLVDRYAGVLTKGDIIHLFDKLITKMNGNRSKASRLVRVTNPATYAWSTSRYIKHDTKCKVLYASLQIDFLNTIEFLLNRSGERIVDILQTVFNSIFNEAMETETSDRFSNLMNKFFTIRSVYRGTIRDRLENEIDEMIFALEQKAVDLNLPYPEKSISDFSAKELVDILPLFMMEFKRNPETPEIAALDLKLPLEEIRPIWTSFNTLQTQPPVWSPVLNTANEDDVSTNCYFISSIQTTPYRANRSNFIRHMQVAVAPPNYLGGTLTFDAEPFGSEWIQTRDAR